MLSIVIPIYNEEESLDALYQELLKHVPKTENDYEIIFVDDGSKDKTLSLLQKLEQKEKNVRVFSFRKNRGKAEAVSYGFQKACGEYIATLDADLQDRPSEIPKLLSEAKKGWDVVCGWRKDRKDSGKKILSSKLFNTLTRLFWGLKLHDYNCGLKVYRKDAAKSLNLYGGMHRFIPALLYQKGFRVTEVPVTHGERKFGTSKYGFSKIWKDLPDIFTMLFLTKYGKRPMHFFGAIGFALFTVGLVILVYLSYIHFLGEAIGRRPLLFLGMLLVLSGFQIFFTGFLADLMLNVSQKNDNENELRYSSS